MKTWQLIVAYGVFLILIGLAGYASNPEKAKTALISGGVFGSLSIVWGVLLARGWNWARGAAIGMVCFLTLIFAWRTWASWTAVMTGEPKQTAAILISSMLGASLLLLPFLLAKKN
jgi:uncharacterized membrane protein (UPF0136 family)